MYFNIPQYMFTPKIKAFILHIVFICETTETLKGDAIGELLGAHLNLLIPLRQITFTHPAMTFEVAELIVYLYGARYLRKERNSDGFVAFKDLQLHFLLDQPTLSKRLSHARHCGWIENRSRSDSTVKLSAPQGMHVSRGNSRLIRIAEGGVVVAKPMWEKYCLLAKRLLADIPEQHLKIHAEVNRLIQERISPRWG
jgi:hypothetical protein